MRIDRLVVRNFRNLADVDIKLLPGTVIVGENRAGKSNLVHALRLILDPTLSTADRQLAREDFWDGLSDGTLGWDPMEHGHIIEASIDIVEFADDPTLLAALAPALLDNDRARLTYRFAPIDTGDEEEQVVRYRGAVYGGENLERSMPAELRGYVHLLFLHALRNVESDIRNWRRSPLRSLLAGAAAAANEVDLERVRAAMEEANRELNGLDVIGDLGQSIGRRLADMVGPNQAVETDLAAAPDDPLRLIRGMRVYVDGDAHRDLASASLGTLNVLYLALLELGLDARLLEGTEIAHVVWAIEEPEAHLHPHLQRLIFRRLLAERSLPHTTVVTTQSPYIASVADPKSLVVLRACEGRTVAATAHTANLSPAEWDDVARYLDATRAELVFARRVLLVEGFAEQLLVPRLAQAIGLDLDKLGISVCAIHGTHFGTYVQFCEALGIPWAVLTDGDPDNARERKGLARAADLLALLGKVGDPVDHGIFVSDFTFEYDVLQQDKNVTACFEALKELCASPSVTRIDSWGLEDPGYDAFMGMIDNAGGKGRYAQRLALKEVRPPQCLVDALESLARR